MFFFSWNKIFGGDAESRTPVQEPSHKYFYSLEDIMILTRYADIYEQQASEPIIFHHTLIGITLTSPFNDAR